MVRLGIVLDGDNCWPDMIAAGFTKGDFEAVAALPNGTVKGKPTVAVRIKLPDGRFVLAETTMALFVAAARAFVARYGDPAVEVRQRPES